MSTMPPWPRGRRRNRRPLFGVSGVEVRRCVPCVSLSRSRRLCQSRSEVQPRRITRRKPSIDTSEIDYQVEPSAARSVVSGYVYNMHPGLPADRLQLVIDAIDASGKVVGSSTTWILGGVPVGSRGYFSASVVPAASYRVQVLLLDWGKGGGR